VTPHRLRYEDLRPSSEVQEETMVFVLSTITQNPTKPEVIPYHGRLLRAPRTDDLAAVRVVRFLHEVTERSAVGPETRRGDKNEQLVARLAQQLVEPHAGGRPSQNPRSGTRTPAVRASARIPRRRSPRGSPVKRWLTPMPERSPAGRLCTGPSGTSARAARSRAALSTGLRSRKLLSIMSVSRWWAGYESGKERPYGCSQPP
jgi:hypothetical protein